MPFHDGVGRFFVLGAAPSSRRRTPASSRIPYCESEGATRSACFLISSAVSCLAFSR
jgi:hypothetical protein